MTRDSDSLAELLGLMPRGHWLDDALCAQVDPELFFPEKGGDARPAKQVCGRCAARAECLAQALAAGERYGIWGGLSEKERRRLRHAEPDHADREGREEAA